MKQSEKLPIASGIVFLLGAALILVSLMLHFFDFGVALPYFFERCQNFGTMLYYAYGMSSFLIPVFLFVVSVCLFSARYRITLSILTVPSVKTVRRTITPRCGCGMRTPDRL